MVPPAYNGPSTIVPGLAVLSFVSLAGLSCLAHPAGSPPESSAPPQGFLALWLPLALLATSAALAILLIRKHLANRHLAGRLTDHDATLRLQSEQLLRAAAEEKRLNAQIQECTRARNAFLATASHEIRTPMNAILGMNGLLLDTPLQPEQRKLADAVQTSAEALLAIANDLLDLSRIEYGRLAIEETDLHLRQVIESAVDLLGSRAHEKGIELACLVHRDIPLHLLGDPGRIRQIVLTLVGNAVKFTDRGEVFVEAILERQTPEQADVLITVSDTGIGITPGTLDSLFHPVESTETNTARRLAGTGLALTVTCRIIELMGGEITASSRLGAGSTFRIRLRFQRPENEPLAEGASATLSAGLAGQRVLIVDDNATLRRVLRHHAEAWAMRNGGEVASCAEASEGIRRAKSEGDPITVVILDHTLADVPGAHLAQAIRSDPQFGNPRLVLLAPLAGKLEPEQLRRQGINAWVTKPVRQSHLLNALSQALAAPESSTPLSQSLAAPLRVGPPGEDLSGIRVLVAEDNLPNQVFARLLMLRLGFEASIVDNGGKALEALTRQPFDVILMDCHMPHVDGFEATRLIRASGEPWANIPIIAVTADAVAGVREACIAAGMDDYVSKPLKTEELLNAIRGARTRALASMHSGNGR